MTRREFDAAFDLAKSDQDLSGHPIEIFDGFGLPDFKPIMTTLEATARCIRWQCQYLTGGWDTNALNECWQFFRYRVNIAGTLNQSN